MSDSFFLDTNILIYTLDTTAPGKQAEANTIVKKALEGRGFISWQVVQEFSNAALKKFLRPMNRDHLSAYLEKILFPLCTVWPDQQIYREALAVSLETGYSWCDALICASALRSGAGILYSEDLQSGRTIRGMKIINPFQALPAGSE